MLMKVITAIFWPFFFFLPEVSPSVCIFFTLFGLIYIFERIIARERYIVKYDLILQRVIYKSY